MADEPKRPSKGAIAAMVVGAAVAIGGGGFAALTLTKAAHAPQAAADLPAAADPTLSVQSEGSGPGVAPSAATETTPAAPATPQAAMPALTDKGNGVYEFKDKAIDISLELPEAPEGKPVLAPLWAEALKSFQQSYSSAHEAYAAASNDEGALGLFPYSSMITWKYTARAGDLVSLAGVSSDWSGGAHPNFALDAVIARANGAKLAFEDLLQSDRNPSPAFIIAVCEGLKAEKVEKGAPVDILGDPIVCAGPQANVTATKVALAPSSETGKFGGAYVYFSPYAVGSYAEGAYTVTVQQVVFAEDLRPEFKKLFAGKAPPAKD